MQAIPLNCHPSTPCEPIRRFTARAAKTSDGRLAFEYAVEGDMAALRIPGPRVPRRADGLWMHTCFEAFLMQKKGYYEFNFAPSTEWAVYRFSGYRDGMSVIRPARPPKISVTLDAHGLWLSAAIDPSGLSEGFEGANPILALSAVIEEQDGRLSYWALKHPQGRPDFHHPDGFALRLDPPDNA